MSQLYTEIQYNQQEDLKVTENQENKMFQKTKDRILRGKVLKLIEERLQYYSMYQENVQEQKISASKIKQLDYQYLKRINNNKMDFSQFNKTQYQPNFYSLTKNIMHQDLDSKDDNQIDILNEVCKYLTSDEILQIGEDPAYYVTLPQHREIKELLNSKMWDYQYELKTNKNKNITLHKKSSKSNIMSSCYWKHRISDLKLIDEFKHRNVFINFNFFLYYSKIKIKNLQIINNKNLLICKIQSQKINNNYNSLMKIKKNQISIQQI